MLYLCFLLTFVLILHIAEKSSLVVQEETAYNNRQRIKNNTVFSSDIDNMTEHKYNKFNHIKAMDDDQFNNIIPDETNKSHLRTASQHNANNIHRDKSKEFSERTVQSDVDTYYNIQSEDRILYEKQQLGLQTNEVEDRPTAMRLTGLRKPLSITDLHPGISMLFLQYSTLCVFFFFCRFGA